VSVFRPSARATGPDGRTWEIYAYRIAMPEKPPFEPEPLDPVVPSRGPSLVPVVDLAWWMLSLVPRLLVNLFRIGVAAVRAIGSDKWTIEAVTFMPRRESYTWTTTREYRGQVLAQIEAGLTYGDIPRPRNASYVGAR
jgi:hypothetical protein